MNRLFRVLSDSDGVSPKFFEHSWTNHQGCLRFSTLDFGIAPTPAFLAVVRAELTCTSAMRKNSS